MPVGRLSPCFSHGNNHRHSHSHIWGSCDSDCSCHAYSGGRDVSGGGGGGGGGGGCGVGCGICVGAVPGGLGGIVSRGGVFGGHHGSVFGCHHGSHGSVFGGHHGSYCGGFGGHDGFGSWVYNCFPGVDSDHVNSLSCSSSFRNILSHPWHLQRKEKRNLTKWSNIFNLNHIQICNRLICWTLNCAVLLGQ